MQVLPASTQQRTPNVTPMRHPSAPQQSDGVLHVPPMFAHEQPEPVQSHDAQVPAAGPEEVPVAHRDVLVHQPHVPMAVQLPQAVAPAQGSAAVHCAAVHAHAPQVPEVGPVEVPSWQPPDGPHHPHGYTAVQLVQSVYPVHVLPELLQSTESHFQLEQLPAVGPAEVPAWQVLVAVQKPHPRRAVQSPQVVDVPHELVPPPHWVGNQSQSAHEPVSGPDVVPT